MIRFEIAMTLVIGLACVGCGGEDDDKQPPPAPAPILKVVKKRLERVGKGTRYEVTITNAGSAPAEGVTVRWASGAGERRS